MSEEVASLSNAQFLMEEINWLKDLIQSRLKLWNPSMAPKGEIESSPPKAPEEEIQSSPHPLEAHLPLDPESSHGPYAQFIRNWSLYIQERVALILALTPHLAPEVLDTFFMKNASYNKAFTEFGGIRSQQHKGFLPSWETLYFILAGRNLSQRIQFEQFFHHVETRLLTNAILDKSEPVGQEPRASAPLRLTERFLQIAIFEQANYLPTFNHKFPAELYVPSLEWSDLVLADKTLHEVEEIISWITHSEAIFAREKARKMLQPGFRALFYGLPGTGKSLTAGLIGKETKRHVFRVDLSKVVSKYIGETEKNLAGIFDQAQHNDWILFFDEADALFGKRVDTSDAKDRYANQEIAYLLQRIENFPGIVILASNQVGNLDKAFFRRFQAVIPFPKPGLYERIRLWENTFEGFPFEEAYNSPTKQHKLWQELAKEYMLTGANIQNILRKSLLSAYANQGKLLCRKHLEEAIQQEIQKEKRM